MLLLRDVYCCNSFKAALSADAEKKPLVP